MCGGGSALRVARAALHMWEEPPISGKNGSGTIFFSGCALRCEFCQNAGISHGMLGADVTPGRLYEIMFELKAKGAHNINLVTADHYIPLVAPVLARARDAGLNLPVVFNTSSYLTPRALKMLSGLVDIYLADYKFFSPAAAARYCGAPDYPEVAFSAIEKMAEQTGAPVLECGLMKKGIIARVLVLPGNVIDAKAAVKRLYCRFGDGIYISVMGQYVPQPGVKSPELKARLSPAAYLSAVKYARRLGVKNGFFQSPGADDISYIPDFDLTGI